MTQEMKDKRATLTALSAAVKIGIQCGMYEGINEGLADLYAKEGHTELNSYKQWKAKGYQVRKGEKALLMWGTPRQKDKKEATAGDTATAQEGTNREFWPIAYLFSNLQVDKIQTPETVTA